MFGAHSRPNVVVDEMPHHVFFLSWRWSPVSAPASAPAPNMSGDIVGTPRGTHGTLMGDSCGSIILVV